MTNGRDRFEYCVSGRITNEKTAAEIETIPAIEVWATKPLVR
jgi:hypothetical protein